MDRATLEAQANAIDAALAAAGIQGRVTGGTVTPRVVRFTVEMPNVDVGEKWTVDHLLTTLDYCRRPHTAALGIADDGAPLLVNLESGEGAHILITGKERAELLNIIAESLTRWNEPEALRVAPADDQMEILAHGVVNGRTGRLPILVALVNGDGKVMTPAIRVVLEQGPPLGVHVVMATERAAPALAAHFPCRIRGLGDGRFYAEAQDWQGTFCAPTDGRKEVGLIER